MNLEAPENGYESPKPTDEVFFGQGMHNGERRRAGRKKSENIDKSEPETPESNAPANGPRTDEEPSIGVAGKAVRRVGLRVRMGCFTWTWFTMTMATGGIANVLHSSIYPKRTINFHF
jgi:hypothetical protein